MRPFAEPAWSKRLRRRVAEPILWRVIPAHLALLRSLRPGAPYALPYWLWCRRALRLAGLADPLHGPYESFPHRVCVRELEELMAPIELAGWALDGGSIDLIWTLLKRDEPGMIVEFGSGASTLVFSRFASLMREAGKNCAVLSIEESEEFKEQTNGWLRRAGLETAATIVHAPLDAEKNYDRATLIRAFDSLPRPADFVLIDGPDGPRDDTLLSLVPYARDGARWVSDDAFRDWGIATLRRWSSTREIDVAGIYPISKGLATGFIRKNPRSPFVKSPAPRTRGCVSTISSASLLRTRLAARGLSGSDARHRFAHSPTMMGWGLRGKTQRALERTVGAILPGSEFVFVAFQAIRGHRRHFGVYPNLIRPRTFDEKVLHRIVFDRRPILTALQDKYAARYYVREKLGEHVLSRLYWVTKMPADIPFDTLPNRFVVKASHGSEWVYFVPDKKSMKGQELIETCTYWLRQNYYSASREWAYKGIEPRIMVEEFISDGTGLTPMDYKFHVFSGPVHMIQVEAGRFVDHQRDLYTRSWDRLEVATQYKPIGGVSRPPHLSEMIAYAERLGEGLDFLRVDLYDAGKVYFGELTVYPGGGHEKFVPEVWNHYLGAPTPQVVVGMCGREQPPMADTKLRIGILGHYTLEGL